MEDGAGSFSTAVEYNDEDAFMFEIVLAMGRGGVIGFEAMAGAVL